MPTQRECHVNSCLQEASFCFGELSGIFSLSFFFYLTLIEFADTKPVGRD